MSRIYVCFRTWQHDEVAFLISTNEQPDDGVLERLQHTEDEIAAGTECKQVHHRNFH